MKLNILFYIFIFLFYGISGYFIGDLIHQSLLEIDEFFVECVLSNGSLKQSQFCIEFDEMLRTTR